MNSKLLGAHDQGGGRWSFRVWAPDHDRLDLHVLRPNDEIVPMTRDEAGYFTTVLESADPIDYYFRLPDGTDRPDPASRFQPETVHGPSRCVSEQFGWSTAKWKGLPLRDYIIEELHVGTFTNEGTFDAVIGQLDSLVDLGITAIELMPAAQFPGTRNWGYDGVSLFAAQNSYGGPEGLKRLVDACHSRGLAVVLDVVYNHLGPEGNYLGNFGPYFTDHYKTPWGLALNFDGPQSDDVRDFFIQNALQWVDEFRIDALRLDAIHAIIDNTAHPFLEELAEAVHERAEALGRQIYVIAESSLNDPRVIRTHEQGGLGLDAQWNDDFHHSVHVLLTEEKSGYYEAFQGVDDLVKTFNQNFVYSGQFSAYRQRRYGASAGDLPPEKFVVFAQNHDQIGNRMLGERLSTLVPFEKLKLAAGLVLLSPFVPLLFMGEEYGEEAPFLYFISHGDPDLVDAVRKGRSEEFSDFGWHGEIPDPGEATTFERSRPHQREKKVRHQEVLKELHRQLIRLRKATTVLTRYDTIEAKAIDGSIVAVTRQNARLESLCLFNVSSGHAAAPRDVAGWRVRLDSSESRWLGGGKRLEPYSFLVLDRDRS